jgi:ankyrin repeat protein
MVKRRKKPNDALWMAVQSNVVEFVRDLLDTGEDPNRSVQGKFPLMEAIELDNATIVGALLDAGATLTQTVNAEGQSLFAWACGRNLSSEVVRRLIRAATEQQQKSSSTVAATSVKAEAQSGPSGSSSSGSGSSTSGGGSSSGEGTTLCSKGWSSLLQDGLMNAIEASQEETVAEMVRAGVPMDEHHENGWTALMQACFHGRARIAKRLIDAGAAVNHTNVSGQSALMFACVAGHDAVAKVLVDYKVDCNVTDSGGLSPLMWAIRFCRQEVVNTLIAGGADVNHKVLK